MTPISLIIGLSITLGLVLLISLYNYLRYRRLKQQYFYLLHDMGNYLTIFNGYCQLIRSNHQSDEDAMELFSEVQMVFTRMQNAIDGCWLISHGKQRFNEVDTINITEFFQRAYDEKHFSYALGHLKWEVTLTDKPFFTNANRYLFQSIMDNIAFNLVRHAKSEGVVQLQTRIEDNAYYVKVRNEKKQLQTPSTQKKNRHSGGIQIIHRFADLIGAEVEINETPSTFEIQLRFTSAK